MSAILAVIATGRKVSPITVSPNWGLVSGPSPLTSASRPLTVPAGNPGNLRIVFTSSAGVPVRSYSLNGGSFVSLTDGLVIPVANGDGLRFRITGGALVEAEWNVYDNRTGDYVGSFSGSII